MRGRANNWSNTLFNWFLVCLFLSCIGCATFTLMPEYYNTKDNIETIAIYPLYFSETGPERYLFEDLFSKSFIDSIASMSLMRPINFILPDSTLSILRSAGISCIASIDTIEIASDSFGEYPVYKPLDESMLNLLFEKADGVIFCDLILYNEVGLGKAMGQGMLTAVLTLGLVGVMEKNIVEMKISLIESTTGNPIWIYTPEISPGGGGKSEDYRGRMVRQLIKGFRKSFPFSQSFIPPM